MRMFILIYILLIQGCVKIDQDTKYTKILLNGNSYYISDSCYKGNEYAKYQFFDSHYTKIIFESNNLNTISNVTENEVRYLDNLNIIISENENVFKCVVDKNSESSIQLYCINTSIENNSYHIVKTIWLTKDLALNHKNYDCD